MSTTSSIFAGTSRYSTDFQQVVDRAVSIASLGLMQMESDKTALSDDSTALSSLGTKFSALGSAVAGLETATGGGSYVLSNSDGAVVMANLSSGALAGVYEIEVISAGSYTSAMSADGLASVADPSAENISAAASFTLTVDGEEYTIEPEANTLSALAEAINQSDAEVEATIVNIGPPEAPDYRLSLWSTKLGAVSVQLNDGSQDLLTTIAAGTLATYKVNGQPSSPISTDTRTVTVSPGLTVTLLKAGTAELTVSRSASGISSALGSFVSAYNAALDELDLHRGEEAGALAGNSLLFTLSDTMRAVAGYSGTSGGISSLADLGLSFDDQGKLSLDTAAFASAAEDFQALLDFLGTSTTDGFLKYATDALAALNDDTDGLIQAEIDSVADQIRAQDDKIAAEQDRIDLMEENLLAQMAAADALIASLEQQVLYFTGLFESMRIATQSML
jgi:flagellar hook-associated protein 2